MGRVRVKICGITCPEDARLAVDAGADAIGLVFAESPRQVTPHQAARIVAELPPWVTPTGVFVDTEPDEVLATVETARLGAVQFHGDEMPCQVEDLLGRIKVIKGFRIAAKSDLDGALDYLGECRPDACLIDARVEGRHGGTGQTAPWDLAARLRKEFWPLILSGGLAPANVAAAIEAVRPFGVDASSGVESKPGRKDPDLVREFVARAVAMSVNDPRLGDDA